MYLRYSKPRTLAELMCMERSKRGLSQRNCANMIGISHTELGRIERGLRQCPSLIVLQMISNAYNIDIELLTQYAAKYPVYIPR